jgi:hypothetical protein
MALTKVVTKMFPTENTVGLHLELKDGVDVVISRNFSRQFSPGTGVTNQIRDAIGADMQAAIDEYKRKKTIFDTAAYETVRTQVDNALTL